MKQLVVLSFICLILPLFAQVEEGLQKKYFDQVIQVDQINKNEVRFFFKNKLHISKSKMLEELRKGVSSMSYEVNIDTTNSCIMVSLVFQKRTSSNKKEQLINNVIFIMKQKLMYWCAFNINGQDAYFVGHRGGLMNHFEENTNDILFHARKLGITYIEIDVLISKDSIPFIGHDWFSLIHKLNITRQNDSLSLSKINEQKITFLSTILKQHQFLILDLVHNSINDQKRIVNYLTRNFSQEIQSNIYLQIDRKLIYEYINSVNSNILLSYNYRTKNTQNWSPQWIQKMKSNFKDIDMFVVNPSNRITENMIKKFGKDAYKIIPVIHKDNIIEIQRMFDLGFQFMMINDIISVTKTLNDKK